MTQFRVDLHVVGLFYSDALQPCKNGKTTQATVLKAGVHKIHPSLAQQFMVSIRSPYVLKMIHVPTGAVL